MINAIVAVDERLGIGQNNDMPWPRNKADMRWFRSNTSGGTVIMGRRTWESIGEKNLPDRINVVVTNSDISDAIPRSDSMEQKIRPHWIVEGDMKTILEDFENMYSGRPVWVIGGANIFRQALPFVQKLYITTIPGKYNCDVFLDKKQIDSFDVVEYNQVIDDTIFEVRTR